MSADGGTQLSLLPPEKPKHDEFMWRQFIRLGERIGEGDLEHSEQWMKREYRHLSRILIPEIRDAERDFRKRKNKSIDEQMKRLIANKKCECGGQLVQSRSGSKVCYCVTCNLRYKAKTVKKI